MENKLGENIRRLRKSLNKTQDAFAQPLGIKHTTVSDYEKGKTKPSKSVFKLIEINYSVDRKSLEAEDFNYRIESPKSDWDKNGGWTPQSKKSDWGCLLHVVEIVESNTTHSEVLLQVIDILYRAVMTEKNRRKSERRKKDSKYSGKERREVERRQKTASGE